MKTPHAHTTIRGFYKKSILATFALTLLTTLPLHAQSYPQDADPPERVARLSILQGNVSLQPAGVDQFSQAEPNYPLTNGDRVYVDNSSFAELQSDALAIRMGLGADLSLTSMTDQVAQLGLAQGSIHIRSWSLQNGASIEIDTPNGTITILQPGDVRIDSYPQDDTTVVTVNSGEAEATGPNLSQAINPGQALRLTGSNPIYVEYVELAPGDNLDRFDQDRDRRQMADRASQQQYVNPNMIGYSDLQEYGEWSSESDYGQVWYPRDVDRDWTPYHNGHWAWIAPWGWTWVEAEPWGFAPFHYGRWASFHGRWGWIPGPTIVRPVYSPALVAFVGGANFSISAGFGAGNGAGLTAWFPLGPRETYVPWYHASPGYVNRVNVTNIYNRNVTEVRNVYNNRTTNIYVNNTTVNNITYVNRTVATTVVPQRSFAAGRPVASAAVHVDQRLLAQAQVMPHPMITPTRAIVAPAPARAVPVNVARPILQTHAGLAQAVPGAQAHPVPVHTLTPQQQQAVKVQPLPNGQRPIQQPAPAPLQRQPIQQATQPVQRQAPVERTAPTPNPLAHPVPAQPAPPTQPTQPTTQFNQPRPQPTAPINQQRPQQEAPINQPRPQPEAPINQQRPQQSAPINQPRPQQEAPINQQRPQQSAPINQQRPEPVQAAQPKPQPRPVDQPRPLINRSEPPPPQPTFVQQRQAIQKTDPGRPLGPQQVENLRNGRPAGPHEQPEPIAHPAGRAPQPPQPRNDSKQPPPK